MKAVLRPYTDAASFAVFDPQAIGTVERPTRYEDEERLLESWVESRKMALYVGLGDGAERVAVYVGEAPEPTLVSRAVAKAEHGLLDVPSGRLTVSGVEKIWSAGQAEPEGLRVEPGQYDISVHLLEWSDDDLEQIEDEVERKVGKNARRSFERSMHAATIAFHALLWGVPIATGIVMGSFWIGLLAFFAILALGSLVLSVQAKRAAKRPPKLDPVAVAYEEAENRFPDWLVVLERLPPGASLTDRRGARVTRTS